MATKDKGFDSLVNTIKESNAGELEKDVLLSEVDPADGSAQVREQKNDPDIYDGTSAEELPEAPVDALHAAGILAQRAYEREQGKQAEVPDPEADKAAEADKTAKAEKK